jgi:hypothetical protein
MYGGAHGGRGTGHSRARGTGRPTTAINWLVANLITDRVCIGTECGCRKSIYPWLVVSVICVYCFAIEC